MHKIFDRSDANSACRACFSRWNTHGRAWRHRSSCRASSDPFPSSPFFHSEFSFLENRAVSLSPPLPLILKLQIERDIRVLFRRMSRWKRSRRDSRPQHPRYYPRLSPDSTNPRQGLNPTQPRPKIRRVTRQAAARLGARGIPPPPPHPFRPRFPSSLSTFPSPLSSPHSPPHYLALLRFSASGRCRYHCYSPTPLWSVSPLHPSPLSPPTLPPFFVISPLPSCLSSPLYYHSPTAAAAPAAVATLPLFLSRASNKHKFEELAYRRNSEGKYFLEIPREVARE